MSCPSVECFNKNVLNSVLVGKPVGSPAKIQVVLMVYFNDSIGEGGAMKT
jgi:hypothetical protein